MEEPRKSSKGLVEIAYGDIVADTKNAACFIITHAEVWVPFSVIEEIDTTNRVVLIQEWFAEQEGLV